MKIVEVLEVVGFGKLCFLCTVLPIIVKTAYALAPSVTPTYVPRKASEHFNKGNNFGSSEVKTNAMTIDFITSSPFFIAMQSFDLFQRRCALRKLYGG